MKIIDFNDICTLVEKLNGLVITTENEFYEKKRQ